MPGSAGGSFRKKAFAEPSGRAQSPTPQQVDVIEHKLGVQNLVVTADEAGMRVDRFLEARYPGLSFSHIQRVVRKGELRVDGRRVETKDRLEGGQKVRVPPLSLAPPKQAGRTIERGREDAPIPQGITLYEDDDVLVLDKPYGLAVQGGTGTKRHVDGMLDALRRPRRPATAPRAPARQGHVGLPSRRQDRASRRPRSPRPSARARRARSIGRSSPACRACRQGRISTFLSKDEMNERDSRMRIAAPWR